jgi:hypothetical protein
MRSNGLKPIWWRDGIATRRLHTSHRFSFCDDGPILALFADIVRVYLRLPQIPLSATRRRLITNADATQPGLLGESHPPACGSPTACKLCIKI